MSTVWMPKRSRDHTFLIALTVGCKEVKWNVIEDKVELWWYRRILSTPPNRSLCVEPSPSNVNSSLRFNCELIEYRGSGVDVVWLTADAPVLHRKIRTSPSTD